MSPKAVFVPICVQCLLCLCLSAGDPPQATAWFGQCVIYIIVMFVEKFLMSLLVLFDFWKKVSVIASVDS